MLGFYNSSGYTDCLNMSHTGIRDDGLLISKQYQPFSAFINKLRNRSR